MEKLLVNNQIKKERNLNYLVELQPVTISCLQMHIWQKEEKIDFTNLKIKFKSEDGLLTVVFQSKPNTLPEINE